MKKRSTQFMRGVGCCLVLTLILALFALCFTVSATIDSTEVEATVTYNLTGANDWHKRATLTAPSGWRICASENGNYAATITYSSSYNGLFTYYLKNAETDEILERQIELRLDYTAPVAPATAEEGFTVSVTDTTITVTVLEDAWSDAHSGIIGFWVEIRQGTASVYSGAMETMPTQTFYGFNPNEPYTVVVTAEDALSNVTSLSTAVDAIRTEQTDLSDATVTVNGATHYTATYTGLPICPTDVVVTLPNGKLVPADQYTVSYERNTAIGDSAVLTVTGIPDGGYKNVARTTFSIAYLETDARAVLSAGCEGSEGWLGGFALLEAPEGYDISLSSTDLNAFTNEVEYRTDTDGTLTYYLRSKESGEIAEIQLPLRLDTGVPDVGDLSVFVTDVSATVTLQATDGFSGVSSVTLLLNGSTTPLPVTDGEVLLEGLSANTTYTFTVTVTDLAGNTYQMAEQSFTTAKVDLGNESYQVTVTVEGTYVYNGAAHLPTVEDVTVRLNGTVLTTDQYTVLSAEHNVQAGTATVVIGGVGDYYGTATGTFVISRAPLTVTAKPQTIIYGHSILTSADMAVVKGLADTDSITFLLVAEGEAIKVTAVSVQTGNSDAGDNYELNTVDGILTVERSAPVILPDGSTSLDRVYDGTPVGAPAYQIEGAYTGVVSISYYRVSVAPENLLSNAPTLPGSYVAVVTLSETEQNSAATSEPIPFVISLRSLPVTVKDQVIGFGGQISSTASDIEISEGALLADHRIVAVTLHTDNTAVTESGTVTLIGLSIVDGAGRSVDGCYNISVTDGRLSIKSGTLEGATVTITGSYTYTGLPILPPAECITVSVQGKKLSADDYTVSVTDNVNAGTATLTVTGCGNYAGSTTATFRIGKAVAQILQSAVIARELVYTGAPIQLFSTVPTANTYIEYSSSRLGIYSDDPARATATAAGTYTLYYRAGADDNHIASEPSYVTVTVQKATVRLYTYPTVSEARFGEPVGALRFSGGRVQFSSATGTVLVSGTWQFADPDAPALPGQQYEICFIPTAADTYNSFSVFIKPTITAAPISITLKPSHTQQFPGGTISIVVMVKNGVNAAVTTDLPTTSYLTWQIGESGAATPILNGCFQLPTDVAKGTEIIIKARTNAIPDRYEAGTALCRILVSDKISVTLVGNDRTVIGTDSSFDVSTLFEIDPNAGEASYTLIGGTGKGTLSGTLLTVEESGTFEVMLNTATVGSYAAGSATATLSFSIDRGAPVVEGVTDGQTYYTTQTVTVTEENLLTLTLNGTAVTSPITLPGNVDATYVIVATDAAGFTTTVTVVMRTIESLAAPIAELTAESVKSSHGDAIGEVKDRLSSLSLNGATAGELEEIASILSNCDELLSVIADTKAKLDHLNGALPQYSVDTVTSADAAALEELAAISETLLAGDHLTDEERTAVVAHSTKLAELQQRIDLVAAELKRLQTAESAFLQLQPVFEDIATLQQLLQDTNALLAGDNLTAEERLEAERLARSFSDLLDAIDVIGSDVARICDALNAYQLDTVTSDDRADINRLLQEAEALLNGHTLNESERTALQTAADWAETLLQRITDVAAAISTETIRGVAAITAENVKRTDEAQLRAAKIELEDAYTTYLHNYTEAERADIVAAIDRMTKAIAALERVNAAEAAIEALADPATVVENDPEAMLAFATAKLSYEALSAYENSLLDAALRDKYTAFGRALTNYHVLVGDGSIWVKKSGKELIFEISCIPDRFTTLYIDGMLVASEAFTKSANGRNTVIVLSADYLESLSTDPHTALFLFEDGDANAGFIVEKGPSYAWIWILLILLLLAAAATAAYLYYRKRLAARAN